MAHPSASAVRLRGSPPSSYHSVGACSFLHGAPIFQKVYGPLAAPVLRESLGAPLTFGKFFQR
jgi:hypothetical protein